MGTKRSHSVRRKRHSALEMAEPGCAPLFCATIRGPKTGKPVPQQRWQQLKLLLVPGISKEDVGAAIGAALGIPAEDVVGLEDEEQGIVFPLSLLGRAPAYFASRPGYRAIVSKVSGGPEEDLSDLADKIFDLSEEQLSSLRDAFRQVSGDGFLSMEQFELVFSSTLLDDSNRKECSGLTRSLLERLFNVFDVDGSGRVSWREFQGGLSMLSVRSGEDAAGHVRTAFESCDKNGDGVISFEEMVSHLTGVFKVLQGADANSFARIGVDATALAQSTARACFAVANLTENGHLTFEDFKSWYNRPAADPVPSQPHTSPFLPWLPIKSAELFDSLTTEVALGVASTGNGSISFAVLAACLTRLGLSEEESESFASALLTLFEDPSGTSVTLLNAAAGLALRCGEDILAERYEAIYELYDVDGSGLGAEDLGTILESIFRVLFATFPASYSHLSELGPKGVSSMLKDHSGLFTGERMDLKAFQGIFEDASLVRSVDWDCGACLEALRRVSADDMLGFLAAHADEHGFLSRTAAEICMEGLAEMAVSPKNPSPRGLGIMLQTLVDHFDLEELEEGEEEGWISCDALSSGLSGLCGGSSEDVANAVFSLYDIDHEDIMTLGDASTCFGALLSCMYAADPARRVQIGCLSPGFMACALAGAAAAENGGTAVVHREHFQKWFMATSALAGIFPEGTLSQGEGLSNKGQKFNLEEFRRYSGLERVAAAAVVTCLASKRGGKMNVSTLETSIDDLARKGVGLAAAAGPIAALLMRALDADGTGEVDRAFITSMLCLLTDGDGAAAQAFAQLMEGQEDCITATQLEKLARGLFTLLLLLRGGDDYEEISEEQARNAAGRLAGAVALGKVVPGGVVQFPQFQAWVKGIRGTGGAPFVEMRSQLLENIARGAKSVIVAEALASAQILLRLNRLGPDDVVESIAESAAPDGSLRYDAYKRCMGLLLTLGGCNPGGERRKALSLAHRLFSAFALGSPEVDFKSIACALSCLCAAPQEEKLAAAFSLYDGDDDGRLTKTEVEHFLRSVLMTVHTVAHSIDKDDVGAIANVTAGWCYRENGLAETEGLSLEQLCDFVRIGQSLLPSPSDRT